ncbi:MAG: tetratricopeptide repeat protein [Planctomycetes bacterium]|nr:tetratricopeptide repeat protein [Planctomycetota bacterium]
MRGVLKGGMAASLDELGASILKLADVCRRAAARDDLEERREFFHGFKKDVEACQNAFVRAFEYLSKDESVELRDLIMELRAMPDDAFLARVGSLRHELVSHFLMLGVPPATEPEKPEPEGVVRDDDLVEEPRYDRRYEGVLNVDWSATRKIRPATEMRTRIVRAKANTATVHVDVSEKPLTRTMQVTRARRVPRWMALLLSLAIVVGGGIWLWTAFAGDRPGRDGSNNGSADGGGPGGNRPNGDAQPAIEVKYLPLDFGQSVDLRGASRGSPATILAALDRVYSNTPHGIESVEDFLRELAAKDADWRKEGTARALAEAVGVGAHLTTYEDSTALLPSEIFAEQGASAQTLGMFMVYVAGRLSLETEKVASGVTGNIPVYAPKFPDGTYFCEYADFEMRREDKVVPATAALIGMLVERELKRDSPRADLMMLFEVYSEWSGDENAKAQYSRRYRERLLRLGLARTADQWKTLRELLENTSPEDVTPVDLIGIMEVLGNDAGEPWHKALLAFRPDHIDRSGVSGAERYADFLIHNGSAAGRVNEVLELLNRARKLTPARAATIDEKIESLADAAQLLEQAKRRYAEGERSEGVVVALAREALGLGQKARALALLAMLITGEEAVTAPETGAQAITLALELKDAETAALVVAASRKRWPESATIWKLEAITLLAAGNRGEAVAVLNAYLAKYPGDADAREILAANDEE